MCARGWPDKIAWQFDPAGYTLTFAEIDARSDGLARWLRRRGIGAGDHVAVMLGNVPAFALLWFAIAKMGAVIVPINVNYRSADAGFVVSHSEAKLVLAGSEFCPLLASLPGHHHRELVEVRDDDADDLLGEGDAEAAEPVRSPVSAHHLVNIQYTSGTIGEPKGCMLDQGFWLALARQVVCDLVELDDGDVILQAQPFHYIDPQWNVVLAMMSGAELVLLDRFHPATFWDKVREHRVSFPTCVAELHRSLLTRSPILSALA